MLQLYYLKKAFDTLQYTEDERRRYQLRRCNALLEEAGHVPFYRDAGTSYEPVEALEEISEYPVIRRGDATSRDFWHEDIRFVNHRQTSGSTASPRQIVFDRQAAHWITATHVRSLLLLGYRPARDIAKYWDVDIDQSVLGRVFMPYRMVYKDDPFYHQLRLLEHHDARFLDYYPQVLFTLAKYVRHSSREFDISPDIVFTHGELLTPAMRSYIEETFDTVVKDLYMSSEAGVYAWECPEGGYHVSEDAVYAEVLRADGSPAQSGEPGEFVMTSLANTATVDIRRSTGDVVTLSADTCGCRTSFMKIDDIHGRKQDCTVNQEGDTILPDEIVDLLASFPSLLVFQFVDADRPVVRYVPSGSENDVPVEEIRERFAQELGLFPALEPVDSITVGRSSKLPVFGVRDGEVGRDQP